MLGKRKLLTNGEFDVSKDKYIKLYPNCDASIWLRSCEKEIITAISGESHGSLPKWLNGSLLRNGPGSLNVGDGKFHHLFDSAALLHKFNITNGTVSYQCRFIQSETYKKNMAANRIVITSFGSSAVPDPCHTIFERISSIFQENTMNDNTSISIYPFGDEFYAFTEWPVIQRISVDTLETMGKVDITKYVGVINHTSHPYVMDDGTVYNLGMSVSANVTQYNVICFPNGPKMFDNAKIIAKIPARWQFHPSYMHTFGKSENYFVIIEQPLSISIVESVKSKLLNRPLSSIFKWFQNECTLFHVICRHSGKRKFTFKAAPFFYLHVINTYETANYIIIDICCYRDPSVLDCMYVDAIENMQRISNYAKMFRSRPLRFVLPMREEGKTVTRKTYQLWNYFKLMTSTKEISKREKYLKEKIFIGDECGESKKSETELLGENLIKWCNSKAKAYRLEDESIFCVPESLCDLGCETPRVNEKQNSGRKYKYFYAISSDVDADNSGTIIKVDTDEKTTLQWNEYNCYPSEPIFVPAPDAKSEDDGVVLSALIWGNGDENRVGLLVLCGKTFKEIGRCVFKTPGPVPKCLHGWYNPQKLNV